MANEIDYTAVLADMEAKRAALDSAIAGIRQWLSLGGGYEETSGAPLLTDRKLDSPEVKFDTFFGLSIPDAIRKFLAMTKRPQSVSDITKAFQDGGMTTTSKNLLTTVGSTLSRLKQVDGDLVSVQGKWGLREWYPGMRDEKIAKAKNKTRRRPAKSKALKADDPEFRKGQDVQIQQLHAAGKSYRKISEELGVSRGVVWRALKNKLSKHPAAGSDKDPAPKLLMLPGGQS
ncbi:MAG: helix-turn-helix domain-containing protein [Candidatus Binataceae bacterium]|jgi:DNA-directed RNA polymerase delta subunit